MSSFTPRAGALIATDVTKRLQAQFPWMLLPGGKPLIVELEVGDSYVLDRQKQFFQHRKTASDGSVRTVTPPMEFWIKKNLNEIEMELRLGAPPGDGAEVILTPDELVLDPQGHRISKQELFRQFCEALNSPVWNPFEPTPSRTRIGSYRVDFQAGTVSYSDGSAVR